MSNTKTKIVIAEDHKEFSALLSEYLKTQEDFEIVGIAEDGIQTLDLIQSTAPDIVLLDVIMPRLDGIGVLERLRDSEQKTNARPHVFVLSAVGPEQTVREVLELGADYYFIKPFDIASMVQRIRKYTAGALPTSSQPPAQAIMNQIRTTSTLSPLEIDVMNIIQQTGVPAHVKGYAYLKDAVTLVFNNANLLGAVTKELYPDIAKKNNTTSTRVERAIRHAIDAAWSKGPTDVMTSIFSSYSNSLNKPTNSEFIATIAERLRLQRKAV